MKSHKKQTASRIIEEHFRVLQNRYDAPVSAREAGWRMVEIYRLLAGEMPQSPGIEAVYRCDETPGVEWRTPNERDPNEVFHVVTDEGEGPDILIPGDHHGDSNSSKEKKENTLETRQPRGLLRIP